MEDKSKKHVDLGTITKLLRDPIIVRIVAVLDITSLSILELLEYNLTRKDINHALVEGVIEIDKTSLSKNEITLTGEDLMVSGDVYYYQFLNSKVRLTELGKYILDCINECQCQTTQELIEKAMEKFEEGTFSPPGYPHRPS
jgi:hypothetical protein